MLDREEGKFLPFKEDLTPDAQTKLEEGTIL
jgi:hypothetical protein